jgi:hypothetical protein
MLKRDGKPIPYTHLVPGFSERLDDAALASYNVAFATIEIGKGACLVALFYGCACAVKVVRPVSLSPPP